MRASTKRMNQIGPKTAEWNRVRAELKVIFEAKGITRCQICLTDNFLGFAHCRKRRNLLDGEIYHCALLCNEDHDKLEYGEPDVMHTVIHELRIRDGLE